MHTSIVIPARLNSSRFPRKLLALLNGKPVLWHTWERAMEVNHVSEVIIATDSTELQSIAQTWGARVILTSPSCLSGTERIASCLKSIPGDFIVNIQGDEPFVDPLMIQSLICAASNPTLQSRDIFTSVYRITSLEKLQNPNVVKVVRTQSGDALYFSRAPLPFYRDEPLAHWLKKTSYWAHIGIYGYRRHVLENYFQLSESLLENIEMLEQLRFLNAGISVHTIESKDHGCDINTPEDLIRAHLWLENRSK